MALGRERKTFVVELRVCALWKAFVLPLVQISYSIAMYKCLPRIYPNRLGRRILYKWLPRIYPNRLGRRIVKSSGWVEGTTKTRALVERKHVWFVVKHCWRTCGQSCSTNAALIHETYSRPRHSQAHGALVSRKILSCSARRDQYGRYDLCSQYPGVSNVVYWHHMLYFFFHQRRYLRTPAGWKLFRSYCIRERMEIDHIGGQPHCVNVDKLRLRPKCGKHGNASEGAWHRDHAAKTK